MASMKLTVALACLCLAYSSAAPAGDLITSLPGWNGPTPTKQYSGYLNVSSTKRLHYWLVEAESNPDTAPTVLWLNGGPGCSSLDGFIYEHGPFRLNPDNASELVKFDYNWNQLANMLYLEAPVGVGFSYSSNADDYKCSDNSTAEDNLHAVEAFFSLFPEFKNNDFFITGESYAGVYVPTLAEAIVFAMQQKSYTGAPLKGIAVGNGCTGTEIGVCGQDRQRFDTEYLLGTAFVSPDLKTKIRASCDFDNGPSPKCDVLLAEMSQQIGHIDLYNMYGPCIDGSGAQKEGSGSGTYKAPMGGNYLGLKDGLKGPDACIDSVLASEYFNRQEVFDAIHVRAPKQRWATCGTEPGWSYDRQRPNLPRDTYPLLVNNMRVVIYNGDWDACVPYTDNEAWTSGMGYPIETDWHPWQYNLTFEGTTSLQVGGYSTVYKTPSGNPFTFITVRGGRHEVPETAPDRALALLQKLINNEPF
eukprot:m.334701 g.334701  ORF g.334701 m.334701 type:complete len:473 (+) comp17413_c0_seq1:23-1441(+)